MNEQNKFLEKLAAATNLPYNTLRNMMWTSCAIIAEEMYQEKLKGKDKASINIGVGWIDSDLESTKTCKFTPNQVLVKEMNTAISGKSPMEEKLETKVSDIIMRLYKDMM